MEKICILAEAIIFSFCQDLSVLEYAWKSKNRYSSSYETLYNILLVFNFCLLMNLICVICQSVFLGRIIKNDLRQQRWNN